MHDIKSIRENPALFAAGMKKRGLDSEFYVEKIQELDASNRKYKTMFANATYFRDRLSECRHKYRETIDLSSLYDDKCKYEPIYNLIFCARIFLDDPDPHYEEELPNYEFLTDGECDLLKNLNNFLCKSLWEMMLLAHAQEQFQDAQPDNRSAQKLQKRLQGIRAEFIDNLTQFIQFDNLEQLFQEEKPEWLAIGDFWNFKRSDQAEFEKGTKAFINKLETGLERDAIKTKTGPAYHLSKLSSDKFAQDEALLSAIRKWTKHLAKIVAELLDKKCEYAQEKQRAYDEELRNLLDSLPNIPDESVPEGLNELDNHIVKIYGNPRKFDFKIKDHQELGEQLGMMSFAQAAVMSGSRFVVLKDDLAKLERALIDFMLNVAKERGYQEISPPLLVLDRAMYGAGQLPKFAEDSFLTSNGYRLIPTSEVALVNLYADTIVERGDLPIRLTAATPCFRSEAGSAGRDTRGMIRLHQFYKTELVSLVAEEDSESELERMTGVAESILEYLQLPYRRVLLCAGDMGFSAAKTFDLEVWVPSQNKYREISSCSNCRSFQARRMNAKYKTAKPGSAKPERIFLHTLNGSALAVGRTMVAIMENYQNSDGSIRVPEILQEKMAKDLIKAAK